MRHAAATLGLAVPDDAELRALGDDVSLRDAIEWWRAQAPDADLMAPTVRPRRLVLRTAIVAAMTLLGLALSFGPVQ